MTLTILLKYIIITYIFSCVRSFLEGRGGGEGEGGRNILSYDKYNFSNITSALQPRYHGRNGFEDLMPKEELQAGRRVMDVQET
jgi:hypothetical protein